MQTAARKPAFGQHPVDLGDTKGQDTARRPLPALKTANAFAQFGNDGTMHGFRHG